ncbi:MAG: transcription termination factor Rho [Desulfomonile tiedjei]|nr:transcription termination factor Rho [Desulfomonile tiedjei]
MSPKKKEQKEKKEKPLEKWTTKELREEALKAGELQGVHGMNKEELLVALRKAKGIAAPEKKKAITVRDTKVKIAALKKQREEEREQGADRSRISILRRKISRLKKQTKA